MNFHKVKDVSALPGLKLSVQFSNGITKIYDVAPLERRFPAFKALEDETLFDCVEVDQGGYGIVWNDELDLSCDELWDNGVEVATPFDGLMSFSDASELWGLSESTLRKAIDSAGGGRPQVRKAVGRQPRCYGARVRRACWRMIRSLVNCQVLGRSGNTCIRYLARSARWMHRSPSRKSSKPDPSRR